jgi:hypothetical protein
MKVDTHGPGEVLTYFPCLPEVCCFKIECIEVLYVYFFEDIRLRSYKDVMACSLVKGD